MRLRGRREKEKKPASRRQSIEEKRRERFDENRTARTGNTDSDHARLERSILSTASEREQTASKAAWLLSSGAEHSATPKERGEKTKAISPPSFLFSLAERFCGCCCCSRTGERRSRVSSHGRGTQEWEKPTHTLPRRRPKRFDAIFLSSMPLSVVCSPYQGKRRLLLLHQLRVLNAESRRGEEQE